MVFEHEDILHKYLLTLVLEDEVVKVESDPLAINFPVCTGNQPPVVSRIRLSLTKTIPSCRKAPLLGTLDDCPYIIDEHCIAELNTPGKIGFE